MFKIWYHGTRAIFSQFHGEPVFLVQEREEAANYARGVHLGGAPGPMPAVLTVEVKSGETVGIDDPLQREMTEGDGDIDLVVSRYRRQSIRYLTFFHPPTIGEDDVLVLVSLYPRQDLRILMRTIVELERSKP